MINLEQENQRLKTELEICSKELQLQKENLKKVNKELDELVYIISHDFRSPVLNIEGLLETLLPEIKEDSQEAPFVRNLLKLSIDKLKSILADLSEIAHVQKHADEKNLLNINEVFEEVKLDMFDEIMKYKAQIDTDFTKAPNITFSKQLLKTIFFHTISNGLKYSSPDRPPKIWLNTQESNGFLLVVVKDNGLGIKDKDQKKIFSLFKRGYTHVEGSGVGLFMIKRILDNIGGKVEVESNLNEGSTFRIFLK